MSFSARHFRPFRSWRERQYDGRAKGACIVAMDQLWKPIKRRTYGALSQAVAFVPKLFEWLDNLTRLKNLQMCSSFSQKFGGRKRTFLHKRELTREETKMIGFKGLGLGNIPIVTIDPCIGEQ
jgi:hypothetical protein